MPVKKTGDEATSTAKMVAADVDPGIAVNRRENAERQGDQQREQKREPGQLGRQRQALDDQRGDLSPLAVGAAQIAAEQIADPQAVLRQQRLVQPVCGSDIGQVLLADALPADHDPRRIAGNEADHEEDDRGDEEHERDERHEPGQDQPSHQRCSLFWFASSIVTALLRSCPWWHRRESRKLEEDISIVLVLFQMHGMAASCEDLQLRSGNARLQGPRA